MEELPDEEELKNRTLYLTNKDLNAVLLELMKENIQINKVTIATEWAAEENQKKEVKTNKELVPQKYHKYLDVFSKKKQLNSLNQDLGTIRLKWRKDLNQNHSKITISHRQNNSNWINSSKKI